MERKKRSKGSLLEFCYANKKIRDVWRRNKSVRAEIGQILRAHTHTHTHAAKLVVEIAPNSFTRLPIKSVCRCHQLSIVAGAPEKTETN